MNAFLRYSAGVLLAGSAALLHAGQVDSSDQSDHSRVVQDGVTVEFSVNPVNSSSGAPLLEHSPVSVNFNVTDSNGVPLSGLFPAAWIHSSTEEEVGSADACLSKTKTFIGGSLFARADLDLNVYYVLTLNQDASISVVDPLFGFGGSKLLTMLPLSATGYDWEYLPEHDRIYVSIPSNGDMAEISVADWSVTHHAALSGWTNPGGIATHAGQQYLWVMTDQGVSVVDPHPFALQQQINTTAPVSEILFSEDGKQAYLLSVDQLTVVDTRTLSTLANLRLSDSASAMDYSSSAKELYILHGHSGKITLVDGRNHTVNSVVSTEPGNTRIRFSPDGRWGFMVNPGDSRVSIIDAAKAKVVQSSLVESTPEYIAFSDNLVYIRHAGSANLLMIPLDDRDLGREGREIPAIDTPGGDSPPGRVGLATGGEGIVQSPGSNAVLVANYHDQAVYFYKEGMAAPMGQFNNFGKSPRSVLAVDHSLREKSLPGGYQTSTTLPVAGLYEAVFFMDSPRVVACFAFTVTTESVEPELQQQILSVTEQVVVPLQARQANQLSFELSTGSGVLAANEPFDITVQLASGLWEKEFKATLNEARQLKVSFNPPMPGYYDFYITPVNEAYQQKEVFSYEVH